MRLLTCIAAALVMTLAPLSAAFAQSDAAREQASRMFQRGQEAFDEGNFDEAAISFQEAFNLDPHPVLLFNLARAHEEMGDLPGALSFFQRVLTMNPSANVRQAATDKISEIEENLREQGYDPATVTTREYVPRGGLVIETTPPGARVFIDGDFSGLTPFESRRLDAGDVSIRLTLEDHLAISETVQIIGGQTTIRRHEMPSRTSLDEYVAPDPARLIVHTPERGATVHIDGRRMGYTPVELTLAPGRYELQVTAMDGETWSESLTLNPGQEITIDAPLSRPDEDSRGISRQTLGWITLGTGAALLAGGATTGILAMSDANDYNSDTSNPNRGQLRDSAQTKALVADILMGTGLVVAAVGTVLLVLPDGDRRGSDDPLDRLVFQPWASPDGAGVTLRRRF